MQYAHETSLVEAEAHHRAAIARSQVAAHCEALPPQTWLCYQFDESTALTDMMYGSPHITPTPAGLVALGRELIFRKYEHGPRADFIPLLPNHNPRRRLPVIQGRGNCVALHLGPEKFQRITVVGKRIASLLVDEYLVVSQDYLRDLYYGDLADYCAAKLSKENG